MQAVTNVSNCMTTAKVRRGPSHIAPAFVWAPLRDVIQAIARRGGKPASMADFRLPHDASSMLPIECSEQ